MNFVWKILLKKFRHFLKVVGDDGLVKDSYKESEERSSEIVLNGTLKIGSQTYTSNFVVSHPRYNVLMRMPSCASQNPAIQYGTLVIKSWRCFIESL